MDRGFMVKAASFAAIVTGTGLVSVAAGLTADQAAAVTVMALFISGSLFFWSFRNAFAFAGLALLLFLGVTDIEHVVRFANLDVILFIVSMMIIIGFLEERGFFDWLTERILRPYYGRPRMLVAMILVLGFIMAALVDEVTAILFMLAITLRISRMYRIDPLPLVLFLVFAVNRGSSATVVGNPIGVLIAFKAGFSFADFLRWAAPPAFLSLGVTILMALYYLRGVLRDMEKRAVMDGSGISEPAYSPRSLSASILLFAGVITGLVLHHQIESLLGLGHNTALLAIALSGAAVALFMEHGKAVELVEKKVDWWTITYFLLLFASVGTLEYTGVTERIAEAVVRVSGGNQLAVMLLVSVITGLLTAFLDNVLAIATFIPVVEALSATVNVFPVWWAMLIAGTYMGSATMIGSTANIVAAGYLERLRKYGENVGEITMARWMKVGVPVSIVTFLLGLLVIYLQTGIMPVWTPPH